MKIAVLDLGDVAVLWVRPPVRLGPWIVLFSIVFLQIHPHSCPGDGLQAGHSTYPNNLRLLSVDLYVNISAQRAKPQHGGPTSPSSQVSSLLPTEPTFSVLCSLSRPPPLSPWLPAVIQLLSDLIYFFLMLNTIIHSHNDMSSAFMVIIRLLYSFRYAKKWLYFRVWFLLSNSIQFPYISLWYLTHFVFLVL